MKIVMLNSGGFDSVLLAHYLKEHFPGLEIHSLFFDYGQKSVDKERKCSKNVSDKLNFKWSELKMNSFDWSSSSLITDSPKDYDSLYLEMRNMIMVSYATSYAQSIGAVRVYSALIKPPSDNPYPDATPDFVNAISGVMSLCGVEFCTPFINRDKVELLSDARRYAIGLEDFCSCFSSDSDDCTCPNCDFFREYSDYFSSYARLFDNRTKIENNRKAIRRSETITSAKLAINNTCNIKCPFCLMTGVNDNEKATADFGEIIAKLISFGIRHFDFFGKEPLLDDTAIQLMEKFDGIEGISFSIITNGKNLAKYADRLIGIKNLQSVTVSYDGGFLRPFKVGAEVIEYLISNGMPVEISLDVHNENWIYINKFLKTFFDWGVSSVLVKPIEDWGGCDKRYSIPESLYDTVISEATNGCFPIPPTTFSIPYKHFFLTRKYSELFRYKSAELGGNVTIDIDPVCTSGMSSVFVNYDGKVYGCGNCAYENKESGVYISTINSYSELKEKVINFSGRNCVKSK